MILLVEESDTPEVHRIALTNDTTDQANDLVAAQSDIGWNRANRTQGFGHPG